MAESFKKAFFLTECFQTYFHQESALNLLETITAKQKIAPKFINMLIFKTVSSSRAGAVQGMGFLFRH